MKKIKVLGFVGIFIFLLFNTPVAQAAYDLPVKSVSGTAFQDLNNNAIYEPLKVEPVIRDVKVSLYKSLEDAQNESNDVATTYTNALGRYNFSRLKNGNYFLKYASQTAEYKQSQVENTGYNGDGIVPVDISSQQTFYTKDLPLNRLVELSVLPFSDHNQNGQQDPGEEVVNGKTMIILNIEKLKGILDSQTLTNLNLTDIIFNGLKDGNIDLVDGIYLRTTKNNQAITIPSVEPGVYVAIRSPFNLTLKDSLENTDRIKAIVEMISGGDINSVLNNANLLNTGDITTNNDNTYLKSLFTVFPKIYAETSKINFTAILGEEHGKKVTDSLAYLNTTNNLLAENLPAFRVAVADYFGNVYDFTGLKVTRTNTLLFGIKEYGSIGGAVFADYDGDGLKGKLELAGIDGKVVVYDEYGTVLGEQSVSTAKQNFTISRIPYDTQVYLSVETNQPVSPLLNSAELPDALKSKKIVGSYKINGNDVEAKISQNIGVLPSSPTTVSAAIRSVDPAAGVVKVAFTNTDKFNNIEVTYQINGQTPGTLTLKKAPLFGSAKPVEQVIPISELLSENTLDISWSKGPYAIHLQPLSF